MDEISTNYEDFHVSQSSTNERTNVFTDSENDKSDIEDGKTNPKSYKDKQISSDDEDLSCIKINHSKSRIKAMSSSEDEERESVKPQKDSIFTDSENSNDIIMKKDSSKNTTKKLHKGLNSSNSSGNDETIEDKEKSNASSDSPSNNTEQQMRIKNKKNRLTQKFQNLISSRNGLDRKVEPQEKSKVSSSSSESADEDSSINKIKQKIKERTNHLKTTIYDPDTSDDEQAHQIQLKKQNLKNKSKKEGSPKPVRMSAKQAMENMHKIKSESNRMLREKEVSLPYHRPKALSLKDIMNRRKPALAADGKALPLKMNEDQLRQYALQLEERQKEMIELCKSESEGEAEDDPVENANEPKIEDFQIPDKETSISEVNKSDESKINVSIEEINEVSLANDKLFDSQMSQNNETSLYETANEDTIKENEAPKTFERVSDITSIDNPATEPDSQLISLQYDSDKVETETPMEQKSADEVLVEDNVNNDISKHDALDKGDFTKNNYNSDKGEIPVKETIEESTSPKDTLIQVQEMDVSEDQILEETSNNDLRNEEVDKGFSDDDDMDMADIDKMIEDADIIIENATQNEAVDSPMLIRDFKPTISNPKLTGAPGMVIDLDGTDATGPKKLSGIELLKERFTYFAKLKTPEEIERQNQKRIKPGIQHLKLKQELENQIAEQRSLEWHKRLEDEKQQQAEMQAIRGEASDDDELEKIEAKLEDIDTKYEETESESEPEENDVILEDKPHKKSALVDDEAEESDIEDNGEANDADNEENDTAEESSDESSGDELDTAKPKKGRIIKAFEDSDEEDNIPKEAKEVVTADQCENAGKPEKEKENPENTSSQDVELTSAQLQKSISEDIFASQESDSNPKTTEHQLTNCNVLEYISKVPVICETQAYDDAKFDEIAVMCSGSFSQNADTLTVTQLDTQSKSLDIGENVLALCTGNFYDNQFISQTEPTDDTQNEKSLEEKGKNDIEDLCKENTYLKEKEQKREDGKLLQSILLELDDPEFDNPKPNKYFTGASTAEKQVGDTKKRFVIDSDDEEDKPRETKKKKPRKKLEDRALQISDDENEELGEEEEELISDVEEDEADEAERHVEYDSEENEVELQEEYQQQKTTKKRKATEFFEQEAELSSEDEWAGSGDEDEAGLDRLEREAGDLDHFHQGRLRRELAQIHMRDVEAQDRREVRLLQELLLEDGELGAGSRQRKFRWNNTDGDEEPGAIPDEFGETQEEEYESEEQWRKKRHERDVFLRQMMLQQKEGEITDEPLNVSFNRSALIKASLAKSNNTSLNSERTRNENLPVQETKTVKDVPSPVKKPFGLLQANFRGSILARGSGTLARLGALAAPLAAAGDDKVSPLGPTSKRNFVFTTVSPSQEKPKVSKRKADGAVVGTPNLIKKLKTEENRKIPAKSSLLDHFKT